MEPEGASTSSYGRDGDRGGGVGNNNNNKDQQMMDAASRARSKKRLLEEHRLATADRDYSVPDDEQQEEGQWTSFSANESPYSQVDHSQQEDGEIEVSRHDRPSPPASPAKPNNNNKKSPPSPSSSASSSSPTKPQQQQQQRQKNVLPRIPPRTFEPYKTTTLDTPMFHMILEPLCLRVLHPLLKCLYRIRSHLEHPMHTNLLPRWTPHKIIPASVRNVTVGQVILMVPLVIFFLRGYHYTFVEINLNDSGTMAAYCIYWAFLTSSKSNSVFSFVLGIPFERMISLHYWSALTAAVLGCFHTHVAFKYGGDDDGDSAHAQFGSDPALARFMVDGDTNLTGTLLLTFLIVLIASSFLQAVRRLLFNMWYYSHLVLAVGVLVTLFLHDVSSAVFVTAWWGLDLVVRYGIMAGCRNRVTANLRLIGDAPRGIHEPAIEISFPRPAGFEYNAGQFVQIAVPQLSIFEFHPVSLSSAPHEAVVTLHIRQLGDWTRRLVQLARNGTTTTQVWMEGPYGSLSLDLDDDDRYQCALLVSGGIGVTPCQSIGKSLLHQHTQEGRNLKLFQFVWAVRHLSMVQDIPPLNTTMSSTTSTTTAGEEENDDDHYGEDYSTNGPWYRKVTSTLQAEEDSDGERVPASVQVDIYCTRRDGHDDEYAEMDPSSLPYNLKYGRPDLDEIFGQMKRHALAMGESTVAVFGCGPNALMDDLQQACRKHSVSVVGCHAHPIFFDLHREYFDL